MNKTKWFFILCMVFVVVCNFSWSKDYIPPYEVIKTKNKVTIYYFSSPMVPLFEVVFSFKGGASFDPPLKSGLSYMTARMLRRGAGALDEEQISVKLDDLAAGIDLGVGEERTNLSMYGMNRFAPAIYDLFFNIAKHPTFPEQIFLRLKTNHLEEVAQIPDMAPVLASQGLELVLLNGTSKARPVGGHLKDLQHIQLNDMRAFFPTLLRLEDLKVLVIGGEDSSSEILTRIIREVESWPCPACNQKPVIFKDRNAKFVNNPSQIMLIDRAGISEAHLQMGFVGPARNVPEFYELEVAEALLSGSFNSRLTQAIREQKNLTYSIQGSFNYADDLSTFVVTTSTRNEKLPEVILEIKKLLKNFVMGKDLTETELQNGKTYLIGSFPLQLQNRYIIAKHFFNALLNDLPPTFLNEYQEHVAAVTLPKLKKAIRKHFHLNAMQVVVAGDAKVLAPLLKKTGLIFKVRDSKDFL